VDGQIRKQAGHGGHCLEPDGHPHRLKRGLGRGLVLAHELAPWWPPNLLGNVSALRAFCLCVPSSENLAKKIANIEDLVDVETSG
jgi:hypothetical protein